MIHNPILNNFLMRNFKKLLSFDESLNEITQESNMVAMVHYWDGEENEVRTCYFGSIF